MINIPQTQVSFEGTKFLTHFEKARHELELATTIDEIKSIRDQASAIQAYLKQSGESLEIQNMAAEIKIKSEKRIGEILQNMENHPPGRKSELSDMMSPNLPPRLVDLGISNKQSSRWQLIATIPEDDFDQHIEEIKEKGDELTSREFLILAAQIKKDRERRDRLQKSVEEAALVEPDNHTRLLHGDFRQVLNEAVVLNDSVSLLLTDPMYGKEYLPLWEDLGRFASRILKPGNLLVAYTGQMYLPDVIKSLEKHLEYVWTAGIKYSIASAIFPLKINNYLKLLLLFSKGDYTPNPNHYWLHDLIQGDAYAETKFESELQQGLHEAEYLIETFTNPGDLVVDPFLGTGTVAVAAKRKERRFIGSEIFKERHDLSLSRIFQESSASKNDKM